MKVFRIMKVGLRAPSEAQGVVLEEDGAADGCQGEEYRIKGPDHSGVLCMNVPEG